MTTSYNEALSESVLENMSTKVRKRGAIVVPVERYSPERQAEFLLNNAVDAADYRRAREEVRKLPLDPESIPHQRPA
jgi:hypothetical protein